MSNPFIYMMMTPAGGTAFRYPAFDGALAAVLRAWCAYLDSPEGPVSSRTAQAGARVRKGDALGYFSCGGSSMALVLRPGAIEQFTEANRPSTTNPDDGPPIRVNAQIAATR